MFSKAAELPWVLETSTLPPMTYKVKSSFFFCHSYLKEIYKSYLAILIVCYVIFAVYKLSQRQSQTQFLGPKRRSVKKGVNQQIFRSKRFLDPNKVVIKKFWV